VGPGIASFLDLPVVTYVSCIYDVSADSLRVGRLVEGGTEILQTPLPAVLTVVKEIAYPRLPTLRGKKRAKRTNLPVWKPADIEANIECIGLEGSPTRVVKIDRPQVARQGELIRVKDPSDVDHAAMRFVEFLRERQLITSKD
jgi:electron transfer flavoprotein beta subunit